MGNFWYKSKWSPRCSNLPSLKLSTSGFLDPGCASKSSEKSEFFLSVVTSGYFFGSNDPPSVRLKIWNLDPPKSLSVLDQRTNKNPTALMLQQPQGLAVWLASCCWKAFLLRKRWLFVRSFNVSKLGSNALTALKSRQRKQGNSVQGAVWEVLGSLSICNLQDLCPAREFSDWNARFVSCG